MTLMATIAENFGTSMLYLVQGMAGIFVFMGLFYGVIVALNKLFKDKREQ